MTGWHDSARDQRDELLIRDLKSRNVDTAKRAFRDLFTEYVHELSRVAQRITGSPETAQDLVQDLFVWVWERRADLPNHDIAPYLFRAIRNRALKVLDHEVVVRRWEVAVRFETVDRGKEPNIDNEGERTIEQAELTEKLNAALATLTPRAREIVQLSHQEGLKPGQIAMVLGITPATVYTVLSRALKQLETVLRRDGRGT